LAERSGSEHLIIQTAFLGDLLLGIPLFKELRRLRPHDKLTLLCRKGLGDIMTRLGLIDEAIEIDKTSASTMRKAKQLLRSRQFEWLICPHQSVRTAILVASLRAKTKIGYTGGLRSLVFDHRVERPLALPEALRQLALLTPLEAIWQERLTIFASRQRLPGGLNADGSLLDVPQWAEMTVEHLRQVRERRHVGSEGPLIVLAPSSVWKTKMWRSEGFAEVARAFVSSGHRVIVMGAPEEKELCQWVVAEAPGAISIAGRSSLVESAEILAQAELLVCNDSGAMHLAAAAGVPTISIFGPTVLEFGYRPWQTHAKVVQTSRIEVPCRPCGKHGANSCPKQTHDCMQKVSVHDVLGAAANGEISHLRLTKCRSLSDV
jgi:heptosyltransferase-2